MYHFLQASTLITVSAPVLGNLIFTMQAFTKKAHKLGMWSIPSEVSFSTQ